MLFYRLTTFFVTCIVFTVMSVAMSVVALGAGKPNIIVIMADDLGHSDLGCFGGEIETPHLDQLAAEGTRFTNFYVASPVCSSSRCALMTGQYPYRWRLSSYLDSRQHNERRGMAQWLDLKAPTLPRFLKNAGYATGHFGKWHLGGQRNVGDAPLITEYGFDESLTSFEGLGPRVLPLMNPFDGSEPQPHAMGSGGLGRGEITWMDRNKITPRFVEATMEFIKKAEKDGKPFYVNLWLDDPHSPFFPSAHLRGDGSKKDRYRSVVMEMDLHLATLFDYIRGSEVLRENTLILFMSDNGHEQGAGSGGPLRGYKTVIYEGGIRSPLIVWGNGLLTQEAKGRRNETAVFQAIDLVPSLLNIVGVEAPSEVVFDGEDFSSIVLGTTMTQERKAPIFWRRPPDWPGPANNPLPDLALRDGAWKFLMQFDGSRPQLYNLDTDIAESTNLAAEHPDLVAKYRNVLGEWNAAMPKDGEPFVEARTFKEVVPTARTQQVDWKYTLEPPPENWFQNDFDDSAWTTGKSGFGNGGLPGNPPMGTTWTTNDIWLRREFELPVKPEGELFLYVYYDESPEIWINGVFATKTTGYSTGYTPLRITSEAAATLQPGKNRFAVKASQTTGGQYIDVGLVQEIQ